MSGSRSWADEGDHVPRRVPFCEFADLRKKRAMSQPALPIPASIALTVSAPI
jgi:hypothetical protein